MQIYRVRGNDLQDALRKARRVHGEKALVVSQEALPNGGVALAVAKHAAKNTPARGFSDAPKVETHEFPSEGGSPMETHAGLREVASHLAEHGASNALITRVLGAMDREAIKERHAIDVAAESIGKMFTVARAKRVPGRTQIMSAIGPAGGGKTTALIKVAYRLLQADLKIAFMSLDNERIGGTSKLKAWAKRLEIPFFAIRDPRQLNDLLEAQTGLDALLLDTSGDAMTDRSNLLTLAQQESTSSIQNYLVLPATDSRSALKKQAAAYHDIAIAGAIVTKLDQTLEVANTFEHILDESLPTAFFSDGCNVSTNLHRASSEAFADLLLTGRLA